MYLYILYGVVLKDDLIKKTNSQYIKKIKKKSNFR